MSSACSRTAWTLWRTSVWRVCMEEAFHVGFVVEKHRESHPAELAKETALDPTLIPQELLRKYIVYAKTRVRPVLDNVDQDKIARMWGLG